MVENFKTLNSPLYGESNLETKMEDEKDYSFRV